MSGVALPVQLTGVVLRLGHATSKGILWLHSFTQVCTCVRVHVQAMEVLLLALAAHSRLQEAVAVLRGCRELTDLSVNAAVTRAGLCVRRLSSLVVSLEFPPFDAGCSSELYNSIRGSAAAMPVAQVSWWHVGRATKWRAQGNTQEIRAGT